METLYIHLRDGGLSEVQPFVCAICAGPVATRCIVCDKKLCKEHVADMDAVRAAQWTACAEHAEQVRYLNAKHPRYQLAQERQSA